jgi:hypothetical protein
MLNRLFLLGDYCKQTTFYGQLATKLTVRNQIFLTDFVRKLNTIYMYSPDQLFSFILVRICALMRSKNAGRVSWHLTTSMPLMSPHILSSILHLSSSAFSDDDACIPDATSDKMRPCLYACVLAVAVVCRVGCSVLKIKFQLSWTIELITYDWRAQCKLHLLKQFPDVIF